MKYAPLLCLTALCSLPATAMNWGELEDEIAAVEGGAPGNREIIARFAEITEMLVTYTRALQDSGTAPLLCPAPGTPMTIDEVVSVVRAQARRSNADRGTTVQALMLAGFREKFPCN
ncbi:MAG: hypothetical protein RLZZ385_1327 [Pseudomonadota bacterium]|jgi:hypothetical protein